MSDTVQVDRAQLRRLRSALATVIEHIDDMMHGQESNDHQEPSKPKNGKADWECYLERYPNLLAYARQKNIPTHVLPVFAKRHFDRYGVKEGKTWGCQEQATTPTNATTGRRPFHHYNPKAWTSHGAHPPQGVALILGRNQSAKSITLDGLKMQKHGSKDKDREVWTIRERHLVGSGGEVVLTETNGKQYRFNVSGGSDMDRGDYWRK